MLTAKPQRPRPKDSRVRGGRGRGHERRLERRRREPRRMGQKEEKTNTTRPPRHSRVKNGDCACVGVCGWGGEGAREAFGMEAEGEKKDG